MTRTTRLGGALVVCALLAACDDEPAPAPEVPAPVVAPAPAETPVLGRRVGDLDVQRWLRGEATVGGTQLVVFWELWCPHCRDEVPRLQQLHEAFGPRGLEIVGITRMTRGVTEAQVSAFLDANGVTYDIGVGSDALARDLQVRGIPAAAVLVDGEVVWRDHPARLTDAQIEGWLR